MSDEALLQRVEALEVDNARLRGLLERRGSKAGMRHQIRNTLAMVRDVVRQSTERLEGADDHLAHLEARLDAVLRIQNTIASGALDGVALAMLVLEELLAHAVGEGERLSVEGPDVLLQPAAAGTVALTIHELATNAIKFGALGAAAGRVAVSWTLRAEGEGDPWLSLRWIETGVAAAPATPAARGFGTEMIENATRYQLGGEGSLLFAPGGVRCTIEFPLTPWAGGLRGPGGDGAGAEGVDGA